MFPSKSESSLHFQMFRPPKICTRYLKIHNIQQKNPPDQLSITNQFEEQKT